MQPRPPRTALSKSTRVVRRYRTVTITPDGKNSLTVSKDPVRVKPPGRGNPRQVKWKVDPDAVPPGGRIAIEFDEYNGTTGPFAPGSPHGMGRGRYQEQKKASMVIDSGDTDVYQNPPSAGEWKYNLRVFDRNGTEVRSLDPGVAIDEDPGLKPGS